MNEYNDQNGCAQRPEESAGVNGSGAEESERSFAGEPDQPAQSAPEQTGGWQSGGYGQSGQRYQPPYSPGYPSGAYPPRPTQGYGQDQGAPGYKPYPTQGQPPYTPYQYNASSGWQQPPKSQDKYEWKFEDYDKLERKKSGGRPPRRGIVVFTVALLCVLSVGLVGLACYSIWSSGGDSPIVIEEEYPEGEQGGEREFAGSDSQLQIASSPEINESIPVGGKLSIPQVAEAILPSVVGVIKYENEQYYEVAGYGSGIVMSDDGYIITNSHVVTGGTGFKIQFTDGDAYDAELIGDDPVTDLAVLKINATGLVPAEFGDSDSVRVGETVIAIGNPAGMELASSVTAGIVSALNREVRTTNYNMTYIQTDAAINPGNSGGALANEYGQVIGINSSKIVASGYEGIGFAIPISTAKPVIDDLIQNGRVTGRVMLGITCRTVDEVDARNYGIQMGLMIESVDSQDLIEGGVLKGDILTYIDDERIYDLSAVRTILDQHKPGDVVTLRFYRRLGTRETEFEVQTRLMESQ